MVIPTAARDRELIAVDQLEVVDDFSAFGVHAFTTTRQAGTFGSNSTEPVRDVMGRWDALRATLESHGVRRLATAAQVHGAELLVHVPGWEGWLRGPRADGHLSMARGTALAITIADCVPVLIAHPSGAVAALHSGWRGTASRIVEKGIAALTHRGCPAGELRVYLGPAICGRCYEVSPEVFEAVTGERVDTKRTVDLRAVISAHARALGVRHVTASPSCTRCNGDRFFSHRAGDAGRQVSVIFAP